MKINLLGTGELGKNTTSSISNVRQFILAMGLDGKICSKFQKFASQRLKLVFVSLKNNGC